MNSAQMKKFQKKCENLSKSGGRSHPKESDSYIRRSYNSRKLNTEHQAPPGYYEEDRFMYETPKRTNEYDDILQQPQGSLYRNQEIDMYEALDRDFHNEIMKSIDEEDLRTSDLIEEEIEHISEECRNELWKSFKDCHNI